MKFLIFLFLVAFSVNIAIGLSPKFQPEGEADGHFEYKFLTDDGFAAEARGVPKTLPGNPPEVAETIEGQFSWTSPEGKSISTKYVADENGYHPKVQL